MNELLVKKKLNEKVTYTEFLEDMDVLFRNLKSCLKNNGERCTMFIKKAEVFYGTCS